MGCNLLKKIGRSSEYEWNRKHEEHPIILYNSRSNVKNELNFKVLLRRISNYESNIFESICVCGRNIIVLFNKY